MADYTILRNSVKNNSSDVIIEFPVPGTKNSATPTKRSWQSIVAEVRVEAGESGTRNPRKATDVAHIAALDAGQVVEVPLTVEYDGNSSNTAKLAVIDAAVTAKVSSFTSEFVSLYRFYGTVRTI